MVELTYRVGEIITKKFYGGIEYHVIMATDGDELTFGVYDKPGFRRYMRTETRTRDTMDQELRWTENAEPEEETVRAKEEGFFAHAGHITTPDLDFTINIPNESWESVLDRDAVETVLGGDTPKTTQRFWHTHEELSYDVIESGGESDTLAEGMIRFRFRLSDENDDRDQVIGMAELREGVRNGIFIPIKRKTRRIQGNENVDVNLEVNPDTGKIDYI